MEVFYRWDNLPATKATVQKHLRKHMQHTELHSKLDINMPSVEIVCK